MYSKHTLRKNTNGLNTNLVLLGLCTTLSFDKNLLYFIGDGTCLKFKSHNLISDNSSLKLVTTNER